MKKHEFRQETEAVRGGKSTPRRTARSPRRSIRLRLSKSPTCRSRCALTPTDQFYTRYGNPTHTVAENAIAELEGTDAALLFSSGMAAITTSILSLVKAGDHIVAQRDIYGGVTKFLSQWLPKLGIETTFVDTNDIEQHERAIRPNTKLLHIESPTNPTCGSSTWKDCGTGAEARPDHYHRFDLFPRPLIAVRRSGASIWCCIRGQNILADIPT
jgi:cystathionine beta-lyase/cystathionine gamma-synthase